MSLRTHRLQALRQIPKWRKLRAMRRWRRTRVGNPLFLFLLVSLMECKRTYRGEERGECGVKTEYFKQLSWGPIWVIDISFFLLLICSTRLSDFLLNFSSLWFKQNNCFDYNHSSSEWKLKFYNGCSTFVQGKNNRAWSTVELYTWMLVLVLSLWMFWILESNIFVSMIEYRFLSTFLSLFCNVIEDWVGRYLSYYV